VALARRLAAGANRLDPWESVDGVAHSNVVVQRDSKDNIYPTRTSETRHDIPASEYDRLLKLANARDQSVSALVREWLKRR